MIVLSGENDAFAFTYLAQITVPVNSQSEEEEAYFSQSLQKADGTFANRIRITAGPGKGAKVVEVFSGSVLHSFSFFMIFFQIFKKVGLPLGCTTSCCVTLI